MTVEKGTVEVTYAAGHSHKEVWHREVDLFCPWCGKPEVWAEDGGGDYYVGPAHICLACGEGFTLQGGPGDGEVHHQYVEQLRRLVASGEQTPRFSGLCSKPFP
jgi:hypothetical protein